MKNQIVDEKGDLVHIANLQEIPDKLSGVLYVEPNYNNISQTDVGYVVKDTFIVGKATNYNDGMGWYLAPTPKGMTLQRCPKCGVKIKNGSKVLFSAGEPGTRSRLWARVCNFVQSPDCINQDEEAIGVVESNDYYN